MITCANCGISIYEGESRYWDEEGGVYCSEECRRKLQEIVMDDDDLQLARIVAMERLVSKAKWDLILAEDELRKAEAALEQARVGWSGE